MKEKKINLLLIVSINNENEQRTICFYLFTSLEMTSFYLNRMNILVSLYNRNTLSGSTAEQQHRYTIRTLNTAISMRVRARGCCSSAVVPKGDVNGKIIYELFFLDGSKKMFNMSSKSNKIHLSTMFNTYMFIILLFIT